ncbi:penicillin-binding protein 2 [Candidatus Saccharibacteria bacterium]|nr:MAG: penicillin-binding protein 2 [Candidatus Saccharibacteria bacterium]
MELHFTPKSRARGLAIVIAIILALFVVRLFYIQVIQHNYYVAQADSEQIKQFTLRAKRGEIYAMEGSTPVRLVMNETVYTVWVDPVQVDDKQAIVDALNSVAGGNTRKDFAQYIDRSGTRYQVLATKVSRAQAELLKKKNLAGVGFDAVSQRVYPEGQLASQVLGFVDAEGLGKYGIEQANNDRLSGQNGLLKTVTDVRLVPLTVGDKNINKPAKDGDNLVLTIDRNIQAEAEKALLEGAQRTGATQLSVIVMNPTNGKVLAMANLPTYDPGKLNEVTNAAAFNNDTVSNPYEPGSDIKTFTVATGIDKGVITPESTYNNTDYIKIDDITVSNASKGQTGMITMQHALNWSLNTGMVTIAQRLGDGGSITRGARETMYDYFHNRLRLGQLTGIELANEAKGVVVSPDEEQGNAVRYSNMAFGQGMDVTMLQVASGFSALVNGGTYYAPSIIGGTIDQEGNYHAAMAKPQYPGVISAASSATVHEMVYKARQAFYSKTDKPGYYVGGKTGTSQTLKNGKYVSTETIGTYLGFGGEKGAKPSYVIMVEVAGKDMNLSGNAHAMPIFNELSNWLLDYLQLTPKE